MNWREEIKLIKEEIKLIKKIANSNFSTLGDHINQLTEKSSGLTEKVLKLEALLYEITTKEGRTNMDIRKGREENKINQNSSCLYSEVHPTEQIWEEEAQR